MNSILNDHHFEFRNGVHFQRGLQRPAPFEEQYHQLRRKEGRIYSDSELINLPFGSPGSRHEKEWAARASSMAVLFQHLSERKITSALEIGCGNGWLAHRLADRLACTVTGVDCNEHELMQAARVFPDTKLHFVYGDVLSNPFPSASFDLILLSSSLQYFPKVEAIIDCCLRLVSANGEIVIVDTPIYSKEERPAAIARSKTYFDSMGMPDMAKHYFHHTHADLGRYKAEMIFDPRSPLARISRILTRKPVPPFPQYRIRPVLIG